MMKFLKNTLGLSAIFLFILTFAIAFTINFTPFYSFDIDFLNIPERTGLAKETILGNYRILMDYLNKPWIDVLHMPDFPSSESGLFHFSEVKSLFLLNYVLLIVTGILSFLFWHDKKKSRSFYELVQPTLIMVVLPLAILVMIFLNFDQLFTTFHQLFFNNDAWLFDYRTDPIILALPQDFFMHCFILVFAILELGLLCVHLRVKKSLR